MFFWAGLTIVCAIAAPFGTHASMSGPTRLFYWFVVVSLAMVLGYGVRALGDAFVGRDRPVGFDLFAVLASTGILTPVLWLVSKCETFHFTAGFPDFPTFTGYVLLVSALVFIGRRLTPGFEPKTYGFLSREEPLPAPPRPQPRLLRRLPEDLRAPVQRLSGNGHFVEVVTDRGSASLRMRLTDAMDEMEPVQGFCVHRSHWVTRDAMCGFERENAHKIFVLLRNGDRLPVSRKYRPKLEAAGLID